MVANTGGPVGSRILAALNLPPNTGTILIRFEPDDVVKIEATVFPSREQLVALGNVFAADQGDGTPDIGDDA